MATVNHIFRQLFQDHGVDATPAGDWIGIPTSGSTLLGAGVTKVKADVEFAPITRAISARIDFEAQLPSGRCMIESCAGFGGNNDDALNDALRNFAATTLHVFLAFIGADVDDQVEKETWTINGTQRTVILGNFGLRGKQPSGDRWGPGCINLVRRHLQESNLDASTHWLRVFYAANDNKPTVGEVLLDNAPWIPCQTDLLGLPWPQMDDFYSVRLFLIIPGIDTAPEPLAAPTRVDTADSAVDYLARLLSSSPDLDPGEAIDAMVAAGFSTMTADLAYRFTQVAWGRVLLDGLGIGFSPDYYFVDSDGNVLRSGRLVDEPNYQAAMKLAPEYRQSPAFQRLAVSAAEVNTVNSLLNKGSKPGDLQTMANVFPIGELTEAGFAKVRQLLQSTSGAPRPQAIPSTQTAPSTRAVDRVPWWQFWKR